MADARDILQRWLKRSRESSLAHFAAEERCTNFHYYLGVPAAALATIVGTTVFASLDAVVDTWVKIAVGLTSIVAAVFAGLQTFLRFSERAEQHRGAAGQYASVRRHIEQLLTIGSDNIDDAINQIRIRYDEISSGAPNVPENVWAKALERADNDYLYGEEGVRGAPKVKHAGRVDTEELEEARMAVPDVETSEAAKEDR